MGEKSDRIAELEAQNALLRASLKKANADYVTAANLLQERRNSAANAVTRAANAESKAAELEAALTDANAMIERYHEVARRLPNARGYALIENLRIFVADHLPARDAR